MTPTRQQKKTWRRRVSRARWTHNDGRFMIRGGSGRTLIAIGSFRLDDVRGFVAAPWRR